MVEELIAKLIKLRELPDSWDAFDLQGYLVARASALQGAQGMRAFVTVPRRRPSSGAALWSRTPMSAASPSTGRARWLNW